MQFTGFIMEAGFSQSGYGGEVVNMVERRRWPLAEKLRIVEESSRPGMSVSDVARKYGVAPSLIFRCSRRISGGNSSRCL